MPSSNTQLSHTCTWSLSETAHSSRFCTTCTSITTRTSLCVEMDMYWVTCSWSFRIQSYYVQRIQQWSPLCNAWHRWGFLWKVFPPLLHAIATPIWGFSTLSDFSVMGRVYKFPTLRETSIPLPHSYFPARSWHQTIVGLRYLGLSLSCAFNHHSVNKFTRFMGKFASEIMHLYYIRKYWKDHSI